MTVFSLSSVARIGLLACVLALGCSRRAAVKEASALALSQDEKVLQALDHSEPQFKVDENGRVIRLRIVWRDLSESDLANIKTLTELRNLDVAGTTITDEKLRSLKDLPNLKSMSLVSTDITDAGFAQLENFPSLHYVWVSKKMISQEAVDALRQKRPDLQIYPL